ncbi:MAG TPA: amino acid aminotransferase, partial [Caldimonas sp.]|nr:amino acid aminotransferase [Caldimonas sp.]
FGGDPILSLNDDFQKDPRPGKINLSIGIYFDDAGRIPVLDSVRRAELQVVDRNAPKPYLPIEGAANFRSEVQKLLFGSGHEVLGSGRVVTIQSVGSSGGLKVGADFIARWLPGSEVWVSDPSWDNHRSMFEGAGLVVHSYPYYDASTGSLAFEAMCETLRRLPARSVVLLHACCHNPTGVDLSRAQWDALIPILAERELLPYLDLAYQGFGDGLAEDAYAVRALVAARGKDGKPMPFFVANSFSKSMSLYGERCGALSVACADRDEAVNVLGQLKFTIRRNYSSPPIHGGQVVAAVLGEPPLRQAWEHEVGAMRDRIHSMRKALHATLVQRMPGHDFDYFLTQRGMFSYTGLSTGQVDRLRDEFAVYLVRSGRMCVAGLNTGNVEATGKAIARVLAG